MPTLVTTCSLPSLLPRTLPLAPLFLLPPPARTAAAHSGLPPAISVRPPRVAQVRPRVAKASSHVEGPDKAKAEAPRVDGNGPVEAACGGRQAMPRLVASHPLHPSPCPPPAASSPSALTSGHQKFVSLDY
ncbi:unnamed protein product [Urochloa humidicola]